MSTLGLALTLLALVAGVSCQAQCPGQMDADVLILGAGMAGLGAAEVLSENNIDNFLIIEQRHIVGGRVQTEKFGGGIVEVGAQWILSLDLGAPEEVQTPLLAIARRCSVTIHDVPFGNLGVARYNRRGENISQEFAAVTARYSSAFSPDIVRGILDTLPEDEDMTVSQGLRVGGWNARTQLEEHVENQNFGLPIAFPSDRASYRDHMDPAIHGLSFGPNPTLGSVVNYPEGYYAIPKCIADEFLIENDPRLILNTAIVEIEWGDNCICAISGTGQRYCAPYAIVTFSIGELQNGFVKFTPELPLIKTITLNQFEMGHFLKVYVSFNDTFWDPVDTISYFNELRGREYYPAFVNWGIRFPEPLHILEAIVTGIDESKRIAYQDPEITRQEIAQVMRDIYGDRALEPVDILVNDFIGNPFFFGNLLRVPAGVGRRHFDELNTPCGNMYLSGEGVSFEFHSTVHGAYIHGQDTAARIVDILQGPLDGEYVECSLQYWGPSWCYIHKMCSKMCSNSESVVCNALKCNVLQFISSMTHLVLKAVLLWLNSGHPSKLILLNVSSDKLDKIVSIKFNGGNFQQKPSS